VIFHKGNQKVQPNTFVDQYSQYDRLFIENPPIDYNKQKYLDLLLLV
jgi:hypothetical protein